MKAIILAAGLSSRLRPRTLEIPKCLLPLHGRTVMDHQLAALQQQGIREVAVVVGFLGEAIRQAMGSRVSYAEYLDYDKTNNLHTLHHCRALLDDACIVLFADVLIHPAALGTLMSSREDFSLLVDTSRCLAGTMRVLIENDGITDLGGHIPPPDGDGNFVGIAMFSRKGAAELRSELEVMVAEGGHEKEYYVQALPRLVRRGRRVAPIEVNGPWLEIDTGGDYEEALARDFYATPSS